MHERLEASDLVETFEPDRTDFGDAAVVRPMAGGLEIDDDERRVRQRRVEHVLVHQMPQPVLLAEFIHRRHRFFVIQRELTSKFLLRATGSFAWAFALTVAYAAADEVHQTFVRGRHGSPVDVAIDAAGALVGLAAVRWLRSRSTPAV